MFTEEIEKYNRFCRQGKDEDFGKNPAYLVPLEKPPFYAFYGQGFCEGTYGGIVTDADMQVLDTEGEKIPGLYAVGDTVRGFMRKELEGPVAPVSDLTWALNSGYMAAQSVAANV